MTEIKYVPPQPRIRHLLLAGERRGKRQILHLHNYTLLLWNGQPVAIKTEGGIYFNAESQSALTKAVHEFADHHNLPAIRAEADHFDYLVAQAMLAVAMPLTRGTK